MTTNRLMDLSFFQGDFITKHCDPADDINYIRAVFGQFICLLYDTREQNKGTGEDTFSTIEEHNWGFFEEDIFPILKSSNIEEIRKMYKDVQLNR